MARRRRHSRRNSRRHRRVHRNARRMLRNFLGADVMNDVVTPVVGGTAGFVLARYAGNMVSQRVHALADPRYGKLAAAAIGIPLTFAAAGMYPMVRRNAGAVVLGMGLAAAEAFLRNTWPLSGGTPVMLVPAAAATPAASGIGSYYQDGVAGLGRGYDLSHAGAPYQGMLGIGEYVDQPMSGLGALGDDPANQAAVDHQMNRMEAVTTITPTDVAVQAATRPAVREVTTPFAAADKGYAGGMFARHIFSGMMGG